MVMGLDVGGHRPRGDELALVDPVAVLGQHQLEPCAMTGLLVREPDASPYRGRYRACQAGADNTGAPTRARRADEHTPVAPLIGAAPRASSLVQPAPCRLGRRNDAVAVLT